VHLDGHDVVAGEYEMRCEVVEERNGSRKDVCPRYWALIETSLSR
jgi:hypothetical protein